MSVIQAASAGVKDMADGSLRITFEFDPRYAKEAYSLFGARGTACAVAALSQVATTTQAQQETIAEKKTKTGELCIMACNFCKDFQFHSWLLGLFPSALSIGEEESKDWILNTCDIESRKELDTNEAAASRFHIIIRAPFIEWRARQ